MGGMDNSVLNVPVRQHSPQAFTSRLRGRGHNECCKPSDPLASYKKRAFRRGWPSLICEIN